MLGLFPFKVFFLLFTPFVVSVKHDYPQESYKKSINTISDNASYILPTNLNPTMYTLTLQPFLDNATFKGWVDIMFDVLIATDNIVLGLDNNTINIQSVNLVSNEAVGINRTIIDGVHRMVTFTLNGTLDIQSGVVISIGYDGKLPTDMLGFYISTYNTSDQVQHRLAITQFESEYARRAFPCFDEPSYRANFSIKMWRKLEQNSVSNMPLLSSVEDSSTGWWLDTFETTPSMPTYLVAFGVSDLGNISSGSVRVFARAAVLKDAEYALSVSQNILYSIGNYTGVEYSLPKMDLMAVPDFNAGAMENWGLNTYRETYTLVNVTRNTQSEVYSVLSVIAHEFGHQWFGDLVTPAWWKYAWLNEAFATFFEYTTPNEISPDWNIGSREFVMSATQIALDSDVGNPRPMTYDVYTVEPIENIFDYVIYEKGGSILRMTENFLNTPVWKMGLNKYLNANAYKTGTPEKLFSALQDAAGSSLSIVNETLQGWTTQPGFPLITFIHASDEITNVTSATYNITQTPYNFDDKTTSYVWNVPIRYTTELDCEFNATSASLLWMIPASSSTTQLKVNTSGWIIANIDQVGFYRVNYDEDNWIKLKAQLDSNHSVISDINRAQLVDDAFHLAYTGHVNYSMVLELSNYLTNETNAVPWNAFITNIKPLINQFYGTSTGTGLQKWAQSVVANAFIHLTSNTSATISTFDGSVALSLASQFACDIGYYKCEDLAQELYSYWLKDPTIPMPPEVKQAVVCTGLRLDKTGSTVGIVWSRYLQSDNGLEQLTLLKSLTCNTEETIINKLLSNATDTYKNYVREQDRWRVFQYVLSRQSGVMIGLQYIVNNYNNTRDALGSRLSRIYGYLSSTISQEDHITTLKSFIDNTSVDQTLRDQLNTTVLPEVTKRQIWAKSSQAANLMSWVKSETSSASAIVVNIVLVVAAVTFIKFC